ncbi:MAG: hypothetical protein IPL70_05295 [Uliginosibacterium sp.]|nr:hypothetical protein [Uliginosibacterium sp.]
MRWLLKMQIKNEKTLVTETDPVTGVQIQVKKEIRTPFLVRVPLGGTVTFGQDVEVEPSAEFGAMLDGEQKRVVSGVTITEQVPTTITYGAYSMKRAKIKLKLSEIDAYGMVFSADAGMRSGLTFLSVPRRTRWPAYLIIRRQRRLSALLP